MGKLQDRENKRKSIIGGMIDTPAAPAASTGGRGRPKEDRELKKRIRLLEQDNEVLRRAAAYLSQANLRLGGCPQ